MTAEDRIQSVERFGFGRRQAEFLMKVMYHSGVCLPRQYATFAGIAYGHKVNRLFERLVGRGFTSACPCLHNRALVYHVHSRALYSAIGEPHSRLRRPVPAAAVAPRLLLLDAVLEAPEVTWLAGVGEKVEHFCGRRGVPAECLPQQAGRKGDTASCRLFPEGLPIGVEQGNRTLFVYPATGFSLADFGPFLRRHLGLLKALPSWTLRLVVARDERPTDAIWRAVLDRELRPVLSLPNASERRVEWHALVHRYSHLSPLVDQFSRSRSDVRQGERGGEHRAARPQPPLRSSRSLARLRSRKVLRVSAGAS
jgi:hypothetical protein